MVSLHLNGQDASLTGAEIRALTHERQTAWVVVGRNTGGNPYVRRCDGVEIICCGAPTGMAVVDQDGQATLRVGPSPAGAELLGWVRQIARGPRRYRLDRNPWRLILRCGANADAWRWTDRLFGLAHRARSFVDQYRSAPEISQVETTMAQAYALPTVLECFSNQAGDGLDRAEQLFVDRFLQPGSAVLDIGCGTGREAFGFARQGLCVTAIDASEALIARARREVLSLPADCKVSFTVMTVSQCDFPPATFDAVYISSDVYSVIPGRRNRIAALERCRRMLRPGGVVMFPVHIPPGHPRHERLLIDGSRRILRRFRGDRVPEEGDRWIRFSHEDPSLLFYKHRFFDIAEVWLEVEAAGLTVLERVGDYFLARAPLAPAGATAASREQRYRSHDQIAARAVGSELLLVHLEQGTTFQLNGTGKAIWDLAIGGLTAGEIAERLRTTCGVSIEQLTEDAEMLLQELAQNALLERQPEAV
jgi:ubiquinone/menaquinone biosynthesis C-methylase UbiE